MGDDCSGGGSDSIGGGMDVEGGGGLTRDLREGVTRLAMRLTVLTEG